MNTNREIYKLECWSCKATVQLEAGPPDKPEQRTCPKCGAALDIRWRAVEVEVDHAEAV